MRRLVQLVLVVGPLVLAGDGLARPGDLMKPPTGVVKQYLSLDMKGARLEAMSRETLMPFIDWQDEPAWGQVVVIDGYEVSEDVRKWEIVSVTEAVIPVEFTVLGSVYLESATFFPDRKVEAVRFRVRAVLDRWRIVEPMLPPHVGQKRIINFVRHAAQQETDPFRLAKLTQLRDELKRVRP